MRRYVMTVAAVIVGCRTGETPGEWVNPGARTDASLTAVQTGAVCVRAAGAQVIAAYAFAPETAPVGRCRRKRVFAPRLADLFEPGLVTGAATQPVKILGNKRVVVTWQ